MSSSCVITGGGRTYRLDLEIITKSSSSSSPSSTLSESSNSTPFSISTKRARSTPRKRPNQSSDEAAALLSTISPKLFSPTNLRIKNNFPVLLPSFHIPDDASLLLREPPSIEKLPVRLEPKMPDSSVCSLPYLQFQDPGSLDFDAESILDEEVEEGIDSIMGMSNPSTSSNYIKEGNLDCLMGFGGLGFGFGISSNMRRALRQKDEGEWWRADVVYVEDILPKLKVAPVKAKKKKRKKKKKLEDITGCSSPEDGILNPRLWLKLDYEEVIKQWSGGSPFSGQAWSVETSADAIARLASIDLFPDVGGRGAVREASMQRYKEKRRARLFSKKIRYQVRKFNADQRPRVKGRFVRTPSLLLETMAEESQ